MTASLFIRGIEQALEGAASRDPFGRLQVYTVERTSLLDKELVRVVIEAVEEGLGDLQLELKPDKKAQLVITLCEMFEDEKKVDKPTLLRLIRLAA